MEYLQLVDKYRSFLKGYLIPIVDIEYWVSMYKIKHCETYCEKCRFTSKASLPFADKNVRGYIKSHCSCKSGPDVFFVSINKDERDIFRLGDNE